VAPRTRGVAVRALPASLRPLAASGAAGAGCTPSVATIIAPPAAVGAPIRVVAGRLRAAVALVLRVPFAAVRTSGVPEPAAPLRPAVGPLTAVVPAAAATTGTRARSAAAVGACSAAVCVPAVAPLRVSRPPVRRPLRFAARSLVGVPTSTAVGFTAAPAVLGVPPFTTRRPSGLLAGTSPIAPGALASSSLGASTAGLASLARPALLVAASAADVAAAVPAVVPAGAPIPAVIGSPTPVPISGLPAPLLLALTATARIVPWSIA
jgi:hypothetical protein